MLVPWELLPDSDPPTTQRAIERAEVITDDTLRRSFLWTTALADAAVERADILRRSVRRWPDPPSLGAGFVHLPPDVNLDYPSEDGFVFGVCLKPDPGLSTEDPSIEPLSVGGIPFPVLVQPAWLTRQHYSGPMHPTSGQVSGTAACWARPSGVGANPTGLPGDGILTAAHVAVQANVVPNMNPPVPHAVVGYAIDAAVLYPDAAPLQARPLTVVPAVAGHNVDVHLQSGTQSATVLMTFQPSEYIGFPCPHRMFTDVAFAPGDSGALATVSGSGDAVALYVGQLTNMRTGSREGAYQLLEQVAAELDLKFLR